MAGSKRSGGRGGRGGGAPVRDRERQIWRLVSSEMRRQEYTAEQLANARALLVEFFERRHPRVNKPEVAAAAVEYTIARADFREGVTQADVARRYGVSVSSISRVYSDMVQSLGIVVFDERFCTVDPPLKRKLDLANVSETYDLLDEAGDLAAWDEALFLEIPTLDELKRLPLVEETWGGARKTLHSYVLTPRPFRPDIVIWINVESQQVLGQRLLYPEDGMEGVLGALMDAMIEPAMGPPRRPRKIAVESNVLAQRLAPLLDPLGISVSCNPTPGVLAAVEFLEESMAGEEPAQSYTDHGRLTDEVVADFFHHAARLHAAHPWETARDYQVASVDLYRWGYERISISIMGRGGIERGLLIFRSLHDFIIFDQMASLAQQAQRRVNRPGVEVLVLTYQKGTELGTPLLKEVLRHGWEVADACSYPRLLNADSDNIPIPLSEESYRTAAACAEAVARLAIHHPDVLAAGADWRNVERVAHRFNIEDEPVVVTAPHAEL